MDKERLKQILGELRRKHYKEWNGSKNNFLVAWK